MVLYVGYNVPTGPHSMKRWSAKHYALNPAKPDKLVVSAQPAKMDIIGEWLKVRPGWRGEIGKKWGNRGKLGKRGYLCFSLLPLFPLFRPGLKTAVLIEWGGTVTIPYVLLLQHICRKNQNGTFDKSNPTYMLTLAVCPHNTTLWTTKIRWEPKSPR